MPYTTEWMTPQRVIFVKGHGSITADEVERLGAELNKEVLTGVPLVHVIIDATDVEAFDIGLAEARAIKLDKQLMVGWVILVTPDRMMRLIATIVMQVLNQRIRFVKTMDEAVSFLTGNDDTLEDGL